MVVCTAALILTTLGQVTTYGYLSAAGAMATRKEANPCNRPDSEGAVLSSTSLRGSRFRKMKFTSLFLTVCGLALAQLALAQLAWRKLHKLRTQPNNHLKHVGPTPIYRITVVARTTKAINYHHRSGSTKIGFRGTALMPEARGEAKVESKQGVIKIDADMEKLGPATQFGQEYLTYVMWAITPEGRATNVGEVLLNNSGKTKLDATTELQSFGLIVTAEPYFAVTQPSDVVVMENFVRKDTTGTIEEVDAKYELLQRGQYVLNVKPG